MAWNLYFQYSKKLFFTTQLETLEITLDSDSSPPIILSSPTYRHYPCIWAAIPNRLFYCYLRYIIIWPKLLRTLDVVTLTLQNIIKSNVFFCVNMERDREPFETLPMVGFMNFLEKCGNHSMILLITKIGGADITHKMS